MLKAQIEESLKLINQNDLSDAIAVFVKHPKPLTTSTLAEKFVAEKPVAVSPRPLKPRLNEFESFLVPAYYQTDD